MRSKNPDRWTENEWLQQLSCRARRLTCCEDDAADLAHAALYAFLDHFQHYPWQHDDALSAWRWCCQKLRSLSLDERRQAQHHPTVSLEELSEGVACVEITEQVEGEADVEAFLAWLPKRLREGLRLRLAGYSWEEAAQQLKKKASTLRGSLPELRAKFVEFFGFDPSNRASESLIYMEGENSPSNEAENGGQSDASDRNEEQGFSDDTESAGGGKHPAVWQGVYWDVRAVRALLMGQLMAICREYYRVVSKVTLLSLLLLGIIPSGQTQRLYIVAPQGDLYDRLHTVDHQYTYDTYTFGLVYYYWLIPFQYVSDSGWVAGTWYPLNVIPTGQRPFIWSPKVSEEVVLTPQFPLSGCQWGDTVRLDSSNRYLFFWTKQNWWDYDGIADPYILAYYSIYNKKFEFYRESVEPYSAWATNYPIFHSRWSLFLLGDGTITLYRYEGHQGYGWRHFDRYPAIWFPPGSPPRWSQQGSSGITLPSNRDEDYLVRFTEDGTMLFGARESYQNYYYIRKSIGSQNWEEIRATGWAIPMASSADNRYTLHNVRITMDRGIATLVDWRTRQVTIITPPSVSGLEPFFWTASGMSADGSHVVGCLYSVYDRNTGRIVDVGRAFVWERGKGAQFIDSKYEAVIPYGYGNERWKVKKAIGISPNDRYILLEMLRPINTSRGLDYELVYGLLDTSKAKLSPESIFVVYRNLTDPNRAYPYEGDDIELRVFVKSDDRYYTQADEYNITDLSKFLAKYRWLHTGTKTRRYGGEQIDLDPKGTPYRGMTTVLPWVYAKAEVRWFMAYPIRYGSGPHYTKYPSYTEVTEARNQWVWRPFALPAGTHRIFVRVHWPDRRADDWINAKLYQPTPGIWRAMGNDKALADWTLLWSQNCDEEDELALRVSVRVRASWITHPQRRALVEWASSFLNVPYEWGGSWYGGRADDQAHTINAGYGIDCSGLVCAAAWMAGYNIPRINTEMMLRNAYTSAVSAANLEPGDLIVMRRIDENRPGHVWIVSRIVRRSQQAEGGWKIEVQLIQASGGANKVISGSYWFIVQNLQSDQVDTEASLEGLDLSGRYADAIIRLRRLR